MTVLEKPFLDGLLNVAYFGIPTYAFFIAGVAGMILLVEVLFRKAYWQPFERLHGVWYAYKNGTNAVFVGDMKNRYELIAEHKAKLVHLASDYRQLYPAYLDRVRAKNPQQWLALKVQILFGRNIDMLIAKEMERYIQEKPIGFAGAVPIEVIADFDNWIYEDTPQRREMIECVDKWNEANPDDEIYTVRKFQDYLMKGSFDSVFTFNYIKKEVFVPWSRIEAAIPPEEAEAEYSGYEFQRAKDLEEEVKGEKTKYMLMIIGMTIIFGILMFVGRFLHFFGKP